jgi:hypothetical protein
VSTCSQCGGYYNKVTGNRCGCGHFETPGAWSGSRFNSANSTANASGCAYGCLGIIGIGIVLFVLYVAYLVVAFVLNWISQVVAWIGYAILFPRGSFGVILPFTALVVWAVVTARRGKKMPLITVILATLVLLLFMLYSFGAGMVSSLAAAPLHSDRARLAHINRVRQPTLRELAFRDAAKARLAAEERRYDLAERVRLAITRRPQR